MFDAVRRPAAGRQARQAPAADLPGGGRDVPPGAPPRGARSSASRSSTAIANEPRYLGQVDLGHERHRGREAVRLQPQRRRAGGRPAPRPDDPRRPDHRPGHGVRTVFGEVVHGDPTAIEDGVLVLGGPPKSPGSRGPEAARWQARGRERGAGGSQGRSAQAGLREGGGRPSQAPRSSPAAPAVVAAAPPMVPPALPSHARRSAVIVDGATPPTVTRRAASRGGPRRSLRSRRSKVKIPLDEVESIPFERTPALVARVRGPAEPRLHDAGPGATPGKRLRPTEAKKADGADDVLAPPPGRRSPRRQDPQGRAEAERDPRPAPDALQPEGRGDQAGHGQLPDRQGAEAAWRLDTTRLPGLAPGPPPGGDRGVGRPLPGAPRRRLPSESTSRSTSPTRTARAPTPPSRPASTPTPSSRSTPRGPRPRCSMPGSTWRATRSSSASSNASTRSRCRLTTPWGDRLDVPLARVAGVYMGLPDHKESPESFAKRLKARGAEDLLLARTKDGEVVAIAGVAGRDRGDRLTLPLPGQEPDAPPRAGRGPGHGRAPGAAPPAAPSPVFSLPGGRRLRPLEGPRHRRLEGRDDLGAGPEPPGRRDPRRAVPGGQMTYLSDLEPSKVEETPFFGRRLPWRRDVTCSASPLKMNGQAYRARPGRPLAMRPDLRPRRPVRHLRGAGRVRRRGEGERARRLPGLRRRQGDLRQPRPPGRRPAEACSRCRSRGRSSYSSTSISARARTRATA